ncbi:hypothetical protein H6F46_18810 [Limnothrix sp. FACHB-1083]|nr:hypothetical protein [Limnothrix sp. FACHB-1083]MBD2193812.1 hypothetical protein [Limnothrix sp. FACHB-1088]
MNTANATNGATRQDAQAVAQFQQEITAVESQTLGFKLLKKLKGGLLVVVGYLLSPLCWWNDLIFNLPIAYGFGALCNWLIPHGFFGGAIVGYWLSNVVGILMMQFGATEMVQKEDQNKSFRKTLVTGLLSSTAYTILVVALVQFGILTLPDGLSFQE